MPSYLYKGVVEHFRRTPKVHRFRYGLSMFYLDLDEICGQEAPINRGLLGLKSGLLFRFKREDFHCPEVSDLKSAVLKSIAERCECSWEGNEKVYLLTQLRALGYVFNPVSFYYVYDARGEHWLATMAEINNTPWDERHSYAFALHGDDEVNAQFKKSFHVSPFMAMEQEYHWLMRAPSDELHIHMDNLAQENRPIFMADLRMVREELNTANLFKTFLTYPLGPIKTIMAIYWNALILKLKGVPYVPHPKTMEPA